MNEITCNILHDLTGYKDMHSASLPVHGFGFPFYLKIFFWLWGSLHCCTQAFFSCSKWGPLFIEVQGLLVAVASLAEYGL